MFLALPYFSGRFIAMKKNDSMRFNPMIVQNFGFESKGAIGVWTMLLAL
jgi:hypothetical protein